MSGTALITGAARRVGRALTIYLAQQGWNIAIHYNTSVDEATAFCKELSDCFPDQLFEVFKADLSQVNELELLVGRVLNRMGNFELLINNASVFESSELIRTSTELLDRQWNVNFRAPFVLMRDFARKQGRGVVVNLLDTRITSNKSDFAAYTLSKKTLWESTKMAAHEFAPHIRVNAIALGLILPPEDKDDDYLWQRAATIPMKQPAGVIPVLKSLDYILTNDDLTGQLLFCDGGENLL